MKVLALTPYPFDTVPGQRFRIEQWLPHLADRGIDVQLDAFTSEPLYRIVHKSGGSLPKAALVLADYARRIARGLRTRRFDVVYLFREAALVGPAVIERIVAATGVPIVYDFDDAIYLPPPGSANGILNRLKFPNKTATICRLATHVMVGNEELRRYGERFNSAVSIVPTTIDTDKYSLRCTYDRSEVVTIGWSGSFSTAPYLRTLEGVFRRLARSHRFRLVAIGAPSFSIDGVDVSIVPWRSETEVKDLARIQVGIMPLPDDPWTRGKCALKALQYMALGIPTVASPVGVNSRIIRDGENGLLASEEDEWVAKLSRLLVDHQLRERLGSAGRATVESEYSARIQAPRVAAIFENALRRSEERLTGQQR